MTALDTSVAMAREPGCSSFSLPVSMVATYVCVRACLQLPHLAELEVLRLERLVD